MTRSPTPTRALLAAALAMGCQPARAPTPPLDFQAPEGATGGGNLRGGRSMWPDAGPDSSTDASPTASGPMIDGFVNAGEWSAAVHVHASSVGEDRFAGDELTDLYALRTPTRLYVAVTGMRADGHTLLVYVDPHYGPIPDAVASPYPYTGTDGLAQVISAQALGLPPAFDLGYVWGAVATNFGPVAYTASAGWRADSGTLSSYLPVTSETTSACTPTACETSISLSEFDTLGPIALFARVATLEQLSTMTLPADASAQAVRNVLTLDPP
jgi:hypothetical protein